MAGAFLFLSLYRINNALIVLDTHLGAYVAVTSAGNLEILDLVLFSHLRNEAVAVSLLVHSHISTAVEDVVCGILRHRGCEMYGGCCAKNLVKCALVRAVCAVDSAREIGALGEVEGEVAHGAVRKASFRCTLCVIRVNKRGESAHADTCGDDRGTLGKGVRGEEHVDELVRVVNGLTVHPRPRILIGYEEYNAFLCIAASLGGVLAIHKVAVEATEEDYDAADGLFYDVVVAVRERAQIFVSDDLFHNVTFVIEFSR